MPPPRRRSPGFLASCPPPPPVTPCSARRPPAHSFHKLPGAVLRGKVGGEGGVGSSQAGDGGPVGPEFCLEKASSECRPAGTAWEQERGAPHQPGRFFLVSPSKVTKVFSFSEDLGTTWSDSHVTPRPREGQPLTQGHTADSPSVLHPGPILLPDVESGT